MSETSVNGSGKTATRLFLAGVLLTAIAGSPVVLDFTLTIRIAVFSLFAFFSLLALWRSGGPVIFKTDRLQMIYGGYVMICCISIFRANTTSEAIFENTKVVLGFFTLIFTCYAMEHQPEIFNKIMYRISVWIVFIGIAVALFQLGEISSITKESLYRITSMNGHKNLYTSFLFLNAFFLFRGLLSSSGVWRWLGIAALTLSLIVIILLQTKAVWFGTGLLVFVMMRFVMGKSSEQSKGWKTVILSMIALNVFFLVILPFILHLVLNPEAAAGNMNGNSAITGDDERLWLWEKSYHIIRDHPLTGVGMGNWQIDFPEGTLSGIWRAEDLNFTFQRPHNDFLWILSETGIVGFNLFLLFMVIVLVLLTRNRSLLPKENGNFYESALSVSFIGGFLLISFFDFPKERMEHIVWFGMILGIACSLIRKNNLVETRSIFISRILYIIPAIALASIAIIAILRHRGEFYTRKMYDRIASKDDAEAIQCGYKAMSMVYTIDPTSVPIQWYTANALVRLGNAAEAQKDFIAALKYAPYNRNVLNDLGSSYALSGSPDKAKQLYSEAARISPRFDEAKLNLAALYIGERRYKQADSCLHLLLHDSERRATYKRMVDAFR